MLTYNNFTLHHKNAFMLTHSSLKAGVNCCDYPFVHAFKHVHAANLNVKTLLYDISLIDKK